MKRCTMTIAALMIAGAARAQPLPRDMSVSPWVNDIAPRTVQLSRWSMLVRDCKVGTISDSVLFGLQLGKALDRLDPADSAYLTRVTSAAEDKVMSDFEHDPSAACRGIGPAQLQAVQDYGNGRKGFWDR